MPGAASEMVKVLNTSMLPADDPSYHYPYHDWMDEIDGLGPSSYNGTQTGPAADRFWKFIGVAVVRHTQTDTDRQSKDRPTPSTALGIICRHTRAR
eukprot:COSAG06_NODE_5626_length_3352_cov_2.577928_2_plen_96_part_00